MWRRENHRYFLTDCIFERYNVFVEERNGDKENKKIMK